MPHSFNPFLINDASGDPGLFVSFSFQNRAFAFDLGDIYHLSPRKILKISHIFISHTHMDHFVGFDSLLRIILGREKTIYLYGPHGFLENIEGKLSGYSWNLVRKFSNQLIIYATEITENALLTQKYLCENGFTATGKPQTQRRSQDLIHDESSLTIKTAILDHGISSLGFALTEKFRINVRKDVLESLGLVAGPWLHRFKQAVFENHDPDAIIKAPCTKDSAAAFKNFKLKDLADRLTIITKGQKIGYVADAAYTPANVEKMINLVKSADHLFIESAFLEKDIAHATAKRHLTARQAGEIAGLSGVKRFTLFHFSPRYKNPQPVFYDEAMDAYRKCKSRGRW